MAEWRRRLVAGLVASALPLFRLSAQSPIDVQQYSFTIRLPDTGSTITGSALVSFRRIFATTPPGQPVVADSADTLKLDLVGMTVDSLGGKRRFSYDGNVISIPLAPALPPRRGFLPRTETVRVYYHGAPSDGLIIQDGPNGRTFFGDNWPDRARHWLPVVDHPSDKARVFWNVRAPRGLTVVTNQTGGHAIPSYCMVMGAARMTLSRHRAANGVPILVYSYPADSAFADSVPFRRATEIVEAMDSLVGPIVYPRLAHLESSTRYGGMENSSAIFYDQRAWSSRRMTESVVRHETAHQWFGDAVTEREWHHVWLSEGFATFFDAAIAQALDGDTAYNRILARDRTGYMASHVVERPIIDTAIDTLTNLLNENSYQKGGLVLNLLRREVGDSLFFKSLRAYYLAFRDSTALSINLQRAVQTISHRNLDWFFRQWLYRPGYPNLDVAWSVDSSLAPGGTRRHPVPPSLVLHVRQTQPAAWGLFRMTHIPVALLDASGAVTETAEFTMDSLAEQDIRLTVSSGTPAAIRVDPDQVLLLSAEVHH